jgi:hypothetical protein
LNDFGVNCQRSQQRLSSSGQHMMVGEARALFDLQQTETGERHQPLPQQLYSFGTQIEWLKRNGMLVSDYTHETVE